MCACEVAGIDFFTQFEVRFQVGHYSPLSSQEAAQLVDNLLNDLMSGDNTGV
jgi:hypothetical protein